MVVLGKTATFLFFAGVAFDDAILIALEALPIAWVDEDDHELLAVEVCRWGVLREQLMLESWVDAELPRALPKATQQALATVERVRMCVCGMPVEPITYKIA